jgi:hypothetical protein
MKILPFLIAASVAAAVPGVAQKRNTDLPAAEVRTILHQYGQCVVKREPALAAEAIIRNVDEELARKYGSLIIGACLPQRPGTSAVARLTGDQYRYALADALVRRELATVPVPNLDSVPMLGHRDPGTAPSRVSATGKRLSERKFEEASRRHRQASADSYLSRYGECVVRVDPAAARGLLLTDPETAEERARFAAMQTAFGTCLPENQTLNFGKLALRGTIALNYYRLAKAPRVDGAAR